VARTRAAAVPVARPAAEEAAVAETSARQAAQPVRAAARTEEPEASPWAPLDLPHTLARRGHILRSGPCGPLAGKPP
jgi:hypothetical protein